MGMSKGSHYLTRLLKIFHVGNEDVKRHPLSDMTYCQYLNIALRVPLAINF